MMKKVFLFMTLVICVTQMKAQFNNVTQNATLTIVNRSDYSMTVKVMRQYGGLYQTVYIAPKSSNTISFYRSGTFYTKTKAEKRLSPTLYKRGGAFSVQCDEEGYTSGTLEFYISSSGGGSMGQSISKAEFDKD